MMSVCWDFLLLNLLSVFFWNFNYFASEFYRFWHKERKEKLKSALMSSLIKKVINTKDF